MSFMPWSISIIRWVSSAFAAVPWMPIRFRWRVRDRMTCEMSRTEQPVISVGFQEIRRSRILKITVTQTLMITLARNMQAELKCQVSVARTLINFPES